MQPNDPNSPHRPATIAEESQPSVLMSHVVHTIVRYRYVIGLALASAALLYTLAVLVFYLLQPAQKVVSQPFRLEFSGADRGEYPNGTRFTSTEIVASPILRAVYDQNQLGRFVNFTRFSNAIFILESNAKLDALAREYEARLADPKLSPVDRERIEREFAMKRESLSRSEFSVNFLVTKETKGVPSALVKKTLVDVLRVWAERAAVERGVMLHRIPVLSKNILRKDEIFGAPTVIGADLLRSKVLKLLHVIEEMEKIPGADVVRAGDGQVSLEETRLSLEDTMRLRIQPYAADVAPQDDRSAMIRYLETQLAFNERRATEAETLASSTQNALMVYSRQRDAGSMTSGAETQPGGAETVMPQLGESFLNRLIDLTSQNADRGFREQMVRRMTKASEDAIPYRTEVAYFQSLLARVRSASPVPTQTSRAQLALAYDLTSRDIENINHLYRRLSQNLNPTQTLFSVTGGATTRVERSTPILKLALYGIVLLLVLLPVAILFALAHNRVREEEELEASLAREH